eukprot:CAMPEP_0181307566 /NCGR_PEP_ID=MMETSP1101-20121128/10958_1 /TAXON_ID=46948 /ORGANISM="Rhodomonas abbreviata, Strain Caron Lab Isolate" /LENGTH=461 /DNA_ID=CAMNT_0023413811 /DNA_START=187 /DNA_END=1572 /DNA_ORIENTATION=+
MSKETLRGHFLDDGAFRDSQAAFRTSFSWKSPFQWLSARLVCLRSIQALRLIIAISAATILLQTVLYSVDHSDMLFQSSIPASANESIVADDSSLVGVIPVEPNKAQPTAPSLFVPSFESPPAPKSDIVLISTLFGESVTKPHLRFFLKSVEDCGVDVLLIGSPALNLPLPRNVRHVYLSWEGLWERVKQRLPECSLDVKERAGIRQYKVIDIKPLYGLLFADEIAGYERWGHIDNDLLIGDTRNFLTPQMMSKDIISGLYHKNTWGPFTIFRNIPKVNLLFRRAPQLCEMLRDTEPWGFDEKFGKDGNNMHEIIGKALQDPSLGLTIHRGVPVGWDGKDYNGYKTCEMKCPPQSNPGPCKLIRRCRQQKSGAKKCWVLGYGNIGPEMEVILCHFQYGKGSVNERLAAMSTTELEALYKHDFLLQDREKGFRVPDPKYIQERKEEQRQHDELWDDSDSEVK